MAGTATVAARPHGVGRGGCAPGANEVGAGAVGAGTAWPSAQAVAPCVSTVAPGAPSVVAPGRFAGGAWLLPVLLWLFGCFFYFGDLGKWTDDYAFTEVDPITGKAERLWRDGEWVLWRPLMVKIDSFLQTVLWEHDWALHLIGAVVHAAAALLVWRLARLVGIGRFVSAMAGLLFLTYPGYYHVVFWSTAIPIGLAALMMVAVMMGAVQWSRRRVGWRVIPVLAVGSYVLTCMYEQPGAALGALPLLCMATASGGQPLRVRFRRAMLVSAPCWAGVGLYVALYWWTMAPGALGTPGSLLRPAEMAAKAYSFCELTGQFYMIRSFKECALMLGLEAMAAHPGRAGLLVGAIAGATVLWASAAARGGGARARGAASLWPEDMAGEDGRGIVGASAQDVCTTRRPALLGAFAAVAFVLALMPVFLVRAYGAPDSRMLYAPAVGLVLLLALGVEGVRALPWPARVRPVSAFAAVFAGMGLFVWFAVMQVGTQSALRQRWAYDVAESARLRELLPNPPAGTVFVPVFMDDMPYKSCWRLNYLFAFGVWSHSWTAMNEPARLYKRSDLFASYGRWEGGPWNYAAADDRGVVMRQVLSYRWTPQPYGRERTGPGAGGVRVPWEKVAAFVTDEAGELRLVTHVVFKGPDGEEMTVGIPMALELMKRGKIERLERWLHLDPIVDPAEG